MIYIASIIHALTCVFVVIFILLQDPKGGVLGALGGGAASKSLFGAGGASTFLVKTTKWLAIIFASTSIYLSYKSSNQSSNLMSQPQTSSPEKKAPVDSKKAPVDSKKAPVDSKKAPVDSKKTPVDSKKAPVDSKKAPVDSKKAPVDSKKAPKTPTNTK